MEIQWIAGASLIALGFIFSIVERVMGMPFFYAKDQINGVVNGFVCMLVGVILVSKNVQQGFVNFVLLAAVVAVQQTLVIRIVKHRKAKGAQ